MTRRGTTIVTLFVYFLSIFTICMLSVLPQGEVEGSKFFDRRNEGGIKPRPPLESMIVSTGNRLNAVGNYDEAIRRFDYALTINPNHAGSLNGKGTALIGLERYQEAIEQFDMALRTNGSIFTNISIYSNKGLALYELGRYQGAIEQYNKALESIEEFKRQLAEITPVKLTFFVYYEPLNNKGVALSALGRYQEAIEQYDMVLTHFPTDRDTLNNKGNALSALGRYQEAIEQYDKALEVGMIDPTPSSMLDETKGSNQYHSPDLEKEDEIVPTFLTAAAIYSYEIGSFERLDNIALSQDQEVIIIIRLNRGITFYDAARYRDANSDFDAVLRINSTFGPGLYYKGLCLERLGQVNEALPYKQRALEIAPEYRGEKLDRTLIQVPDLPIEELFPD